MTLMRVGDTGTAKLVIKDMAGNVIEEKDLRQPVEPIRFYVYPVDPEGPKIIPLSDFSTKVTILAGSKIGLWGVHATARFRHGTPGIEIATEELTVAAPPPEPASGSIVITDIHPA